MSGHSHAKTIKRQKDITDKKRGQIFSKLTRLILAVTREHGPNPESNPKLRMAIETARSFNMPKDNIDRAIKRGSGEAIGEKLEEVLFEAYGPGGIAIIIEGITDNKNRALGEIKQILNQNGGKLVQEGAVKWMFERKGSIIIDAKNQIINTEPKEEFELKIIEAGAQDINWQGDLLEIYTNVEDLEQVKKLIEEKEIKIESTSLDWIPKEKINLDKKAEEACQKLFEVLDESETVQDIYSNLKI